MMDDVLRMIQIAAFTIAAVCFTIYATYRMTKNEFQQQAFDRGFMVECAGDTGYYWECE